MTNQLRATTVDARRGRPLDEFVSSPARSPSRGMRAAAAATGRLRPQEAVVEPEWKPVDLSVTQRHDLIEMWTTMFTDIYVHYTQKRALYGFDPIRALSERCDDRSRTWTRRVPARADPADQPAPRPAHPALRRRGRSHAHRARRRAALPRRALRLAPLPDLRRHQDERRRPRRRLRGRRRSHDLERRPVRPGRRPLRRDPHRRTPRRTARAGARNLHPTTARIPSTSRRAVGRDRLPTRDGQRRRPGSHDPVRWRAIEPARPSPPTNRIEMRTRRAIDMHQRNRPPRAKAPLRHRALGARPDQRCSRPPRPTTGWPPASPTPSRHES